MTIIVVGEYNFMKRNTDFQFQKLLVKLIVLEK